MDAIRAADLRPASDSRAGAWSGDHAPSRWLGGFQTALIVASVVQFLRCDGAPYLWVLVALALPMARFCGDPAYRRRLLIGIRRLWASAEGFAADSERLPYRAAFLLIVLPAGLFFLSQTRPIMTGDSKPITLTASSLVCDGTSDLSGFATLYGAENHFNSPSELPYFLRRTAHGIHSSYHSGTIVLAVPSAALARLLGARLQEINAQNHLEKGIASWLAAACLGLFFLLALHLVDARAAGWMTLFLTVGSALCSTVAQALWQHGAVVFWMLLLLLVEFRTWRRPTHGGVLLQGVALAMMFASRLSSAVLILCFGLWLLARSPRRAALVGLLGVLAYVPWAWYYQSIYGTPFGPSIAQMMGFAVRWRETVLPMLLSPDHGLLFYQPWILLGLAAFIRQVRRHTPVGERNDLPAGWRWFCVVAVVLHLTLVASWNCWWGGDCWGSRLATETVPLFALLCLRPLAGLLRLTWGRRLVWAMLVVAAFPHLSGVYLKANYCDHQTGLFSQRMELPGSWHNLPFFTPFANRFPH